MCSRSPKKGGYPGDCWQPWRQVLCMEMLCREKCVNVPQLVRGKAQTFGKVERKRLRGWERTNTSTGSYFLRMMPRQCNENIVDSWKEVNFGLIDLVKRRLLLFVCTS